MDKKTDKIKINPAKKTVEKKMKNTKKSIAKKLVIAPNETKNQPVTLKVKESTKKFDEPEDLTAVHDYYKTMIMNMQKSYENEFETLKKYIIKQNTRHKQGLKNAEKTHNQLMREKDREVRNVKVENSQFKDIVKNKDMDIKELKEEILRLDKELK